MDELADNIVTIASTRQVTVEERLTNNIAKLAGNCWREPQKMSATRWH